MKGGTSLHTSNKWNDNVGTIFGYLCTCVWLTLNWQNGQLPYKKRSGQPWTVDDNHTT